jgi:hypothetical protein
LGKTYVVKKCGIVERQSFPPQGVGGGGSVVTVTQRSPHRIGFIV